MVVVRGLVIVRRMDSECAHSQPRHVPKPILREELGTPLLVPGRRGGAELACCCGLWPVDAWMGGRGMLGELEVTEPFLSDVPILESKKR